MLARMVLERTTHRIILHRRLPAPFGSARIYVSSEGGLRYLRPSMARVDPALLRLAADVVKPGDTVWDIGANLGLFSFAASVAAGSTGHVLALEPDTVMAGLLQRSTRANNAHAPVDVLPTAVTDKVGVVRFHIAKRNRSTSHLEGAGTNQTGGIRATQLVPTVTLDWLAEWFPMPSVIKIDVEAAELEVLTGAERVLRAGPAIICEVSGENSAVIGDLLAANDYTIYDGDKSADKREPTTAAPPQTLALSRSRQRTGSQIT